MDQMRLDGFGKNLGTITNPYARLANPPVVYTGAFKAVRSIPSCFGEDGQYDTTDLEDSGTYETATSYVMK